MRSRFLYVVLGASLLLLPILCTSCLTPRDLRRISDPTLDPSIASAPRTLVVLQPFQKGASSYPAGRYVATLSDGKGIYYEAPEKVIQKDFTGASTVVGGFYFSADNPQSIRNYIEYNGQMVKYIGEVTHLFYRFEK